jgi:hypothetical protein
MLYNYMSKIKYHVAGLYYMLFRLLHIYITTIFVEK